MILLLIGAVTFIAVVLAVLYAASTAETKLAGRAYLRAIETYTWSDDGVKAEEKSLADRIVVPFVERMTTLGKRFTPVGYVEGVRLKLVHAGRRGPDELDRFLAIRVISVVAIPVIGILLWVLPLDPKSAFLMFALLALALAIGPDAYLNRETGDRQKRIRRSLPDFLDLLTISVEAGLGFEQAIDRITAAMPGPLTDEFNRMIGEMRAGSSRAEALSAMDERIGVDEVKSFVLAMVQADTFGVSIGRVLRAQSDEMRIKRRQLAQEAAQKAPVKMLIPMTFLIFPALFVVVLGPALIQIINSL